MKWTRGLLFGVSAFGIFWWLFKGLLFLSGKLPKPTLSSKGHALKVLSYFSPFSSFLLWIFLFLPYYCAPILCCFLVHLLGLCWVSQYHGLVFLFLWIVTETQNVSQCMALTSTHSQNLMESVEHVMVADPYSTCCCWRSLIFVWQSLLLKPLPSIVLPFFWGWVSSLFPIHWYVFRSEILTSIIVSSLNSIRVTKIKVWKNSFVFYFTAERLSGFGQMTTAIAIEDVRREVKILRALSGHQNLVRFYDSCEDNLNVYIVME